MSDVLFPYETLAESLDVEVSLPSVPGRTVPSTIRNVEERMLNLFEIDGNWQRLELAIAATTNRDNLKEFETKHGRVAIVVVAHCRPTNSRQTFRPERSETDSSRWEGTMELDRDNFRDRVELRTLLASESGGSPHRPVAIGSTWTLHFDEPASMKLRGTLNVRWVDFKKPDAHPLARQFPDSTHVISMENALPEIWLNSSFEGLQPLLRDSKDRRGAEKGLHDMQRLSIARSVWMALVADAMAAVRKSDDDDGDSEPQWPELDWQAEVLRRVLPEVEPGISETELLRRAADEWSKHPGSAVFLPRAEAVVGDLIKANESLRRFLHTYQARSD